MAKKRLVEIINAMCEREMRRGEERRERCESVWAIRFHSWPRKKSREVLMTSRYIGEDPTGCWVRMSNEGITSFLPWSTDDPVAEASFTVPVTCM
jgi:hypothetical protein